MLDGSEQETPAPLQQQGTMTPASTITPGFDKDSALNKMEVDAQLAEIKDINGFMPYQ
jgi:hypothetical protein